MIKAGEFMGFPVYIDAGMDPSTIKMVSLKWDHHTQQMQRNEVLLIKLAAPVDLAEALAKPRPR